MLDEYEVVGKCDDVMQCFHKVSSSIHQIKEKLEAYAEFYNVGSISELFEFINKEGNGVKQEEIIKTRTLFSQYWELIREQKILINRINKLGEGRACI
jgi:hypothetical protein